ncbi:hypothetical protein AZE42_13749 [Rhizopogon vesiculosus]|uniref:Uncharacterized protein n=1 Tax=Rhizopogon vesiculosus TaxID=180088 RepID=A0A1J8R5A1_9AGAM|nr:hypothetical protein AZE42_13749 [Rhizopogon vesiculosus]
MLLTNSSIGRTVSERVHLLSRAYQAIFCQGLMVVDANAHAHAQISAAKLAYGRKPIYGWHPSNSEEDQGEAYRVLAGKWDLLERWIGMSKLERTVARFQQV